MSYSNAYEIVVSASKRAGLGRRVTPHTMRHCFGTGLRTGGADRDVIATLMGHRSISSADVYLHPSDAELIAAVENMRNVRALVKRP